MPLTNQTCSPGYVEALPCSVGPCKHSISNGDILYKEIYKNKSNRIRSSAQSGVLWFDLVFAQSLDCRQSQEGIGEAGVIIERMG